MSKLYHARFINRPKKEGTSVPSGGRIESIVLQDIHPLVWSSQPPDSYHSYYWSEIIDWREIDDPDGSIAKAIREGGILSIEGPSE